MTLENQKEWFSHAYARAVAATAGINVGKFDVDDESIDLSFKRRGGGGVVRSPQVDAQLKCTSGATIYPTEIAFDLKMKNYDELRATDLSVHRILVVVVVPEDASTWLNHSESELALRNCGYWLSLRGYPPVPNSETRVVRIPRNNQFTVVGLLGIMQRIGNGQHP